MYAITGLGIPCPWRYFTHTLCPFCGATSMGAALLRGDFGAAWAANQFVLLILAVLTVACLVWTIELVSGLSLRWPAWLRNQRLWYLSLGSAAVLFAFLRNLVPLG